MGPEDKYLDAKDVEFTNLFRRCVSTQGSEIHLLHDSNRHTTIMQTTPLVTGPQGLDNVAEMKLHAMQTEMHMMEQKLLSALNGLAEANEKIKDLMAEVFDE
jgi:hypothetical protein